MGLPHSDIPGSQPAGGSPGLIAAIHVLHRLLVPRHPPCALASSASRSLDLTKPAGSTFSTSSSRNFSKKPLLSTELGGTERLYLSAQLLFDSSGAGSSPSEAQKKARRPSSHSGHRKSSATYAIGDSSLRMIRLSSGPRDHTRQATASARAPRTSTISGCLSHVQVSLFWPRRGGAEGTRTPDIRLAKAALSQLSYGPAVQPTRSGWASLESNQGPQSYQDCALAD